MTTDTDTPQTEPMSGDVMTAREAAVIARGREMDATTFEGIQSVFSNGTAFLLASKMADMLSAASVIPDDYRGNPANCLIAIDYAARLKVSPVMLMQNMDVIYGRPGLRGTFLAGVINASPLFSRLAYEWKADASGQRIEPGKPGSGCRAVATELATGNELTGAWVTWDMVLGEDWLTKKGSKWKTMPEQMFIYRATAFWSRAHASDITLGLYETSELIDSCAPPSSTVRTLSAGAPAAVSASGMAEVAAGLKRKVSADLPASAQQKPLQVDPDTNEVLPPELQ